MSSSTSTNYDGLTRNIWPGTWSPSSTHPIVLDTEIRGSLQSITGDLGDRLTDIYGQRLQEGMMVYVKTTYTASSYTRTGDNYYTYRLLPGDVRNVSTGAAPNTEANWSLVSLGGGSGEGYWGSVGYTGSVGFTGSQGDQGYWGSVGYTGSRGSLGPQGYWGSVGYTGSRGIQGLQGYWGSVGYVGSQGEKGDSGVGAIDVQIMNVPTTSTVSTINFSTGTTAVLVGNTLTVTVSGIIGGGSYNLDGGYPNTNYGGIPKLDGGGVT